LKTWLVLALIQSLNADLLTHDSATETLRRWCSARHMADPPKIVAERILGHDKPADAEVRRRLRAGPSEAIRYRRVALVCGRRVLSNADNWYRPGRLTDAMNTELDTTNHPFGAVVRPLAFHRVTLSARLIASPDAVLRHVALLETADGAPFSLVVETYTPAILDEGP
jgi:chorismate-pyruvate lyase